MTNPFQLGLDKNKKNNITIDKNIRDSKKDSIKSNTARNKQIIQNITKTLAPVIINQLTNTLSKLITQNNKLQELVTQTNITIDNAITPEQINQAILSKNAALSLINNQEQKVLTVKKSLDSINTVVSFTNVIVNTLGPLILPIPVPSPAPDVVTSPKENFRKKVYEPALLLLNELSLIIPVISTQLNSIISNLENLKSQLHNINDMIDLKLPNNMNIGLNFGTNFDSYKGFTFALKEDDNPKFNVRGNKRHYAVAIDRNNVEVLKSELSYTQDPNDLIEQLKIKIDSDNLIG